MSKTGYTLAGAATPTTDPLPVYAGSVDPAADYIALYATGAGGTVAVNRNTLLGLSSAPVGVNDAQALNNKQLNSPILVTPDLGTPTALTLTNATSLPIGSLTGSKTGTGALVFGTAPTISNPSITGGGSWAGSPTLTTPTIASFINAIHTHVDAPGGGQLGFAALISTIFGGQVQTQANTGSAGGTMQYVNLGGIKILWGVSASQSVSGAGFLATPAVNFTLPTSFFTTIQAVTAKISNQTNTNFSDYVLGTYSTTTVGVILTQFSGGNGAGICNLIVIGA